MSQTVVYSGDLISWWASNLSGYYKGDELGAIIVKTSSSSDANETQGFWAVDASDATTNIPSNAIIDSVDVAVPCQSYFNEENEEYWVFWSCANACYGHTPNATWWTHKQELDTHPPIGWPDNTYHQSFTIGWNTLAPGSTPVTINRNGYTNIWCCAMNAGEPMFAPDSYAYFGTNLRLTINWHLPPSVGASPLQLMVGR